jgi:hypothetical protein
MQGSRLGWRTDVVDVMASGGRFTVTACSLRLLVRVTDTFETRPLADSRSARVLIPAGLFEATFERARQAGAARVDVQIGSSGTRLCFPAGGQRISVPVPQVVGSPPPTDELLRASQSSVRREPVFEVPPASLVRLLRIVKGVCPGAPLGLSLSARGLLRWDARSGSRSLVVAMQTPPTGSADIE